MQVKATIKVKKRSGSFKMVKYGYSMGKYRWIFKYLYLSYFPSKKLEPWEI